MMKQSELAARNQLVTGAPEPSTKKQRQRGIDPDVLNLAEKFVEDDARPEPWLATDRDSLAEEIQRAIEDWFGAR